MAQKIGRCESEWSYISQGSVGTCLRCGGIVGDEFVTDSLLSLKVKQFCV